MLVRVRDIKGNYPAVDSTPFVLHNNGQRDRPDSNLPLRCPHQAGVVAWPLTVLMLIAVLLVANAHIGLLSNFIEEPYAPSSYHWLKIPIGVMVSIIGAGCIIIGFIGLIAFQDVKPIVVALGMFLAGFFILFPLGIGCLLTF